MCCISEFRTNFLRFARKNLRVRDRTKLSDILYLIMLDSEFTWHTYTYIYSNPNRIERPTVNGKAIRLEHSLYSLSFSFLLSVFFVLSPFLSLSLSTARNPPSFEENDAWVTNQSIEPRYPQPDRAAAVVALSSWRMVERNQGDKEGRAGGGMAGWVASDSIFTY